MLPTKNTFQTLDWDGKRINVDGTLCSRHSLSNRTILPGPPGPYSYRRSRENNVKQPKTISNKPSIHTECTIEYIGQLNKLEKLNLTTEIVKGIKLRWVTVGRLTYILRN